MESFAAALEQCLAKPPVRRRPRVGLSVALAALAVTMIVLGGIIFFARTKHATVLVSVDVDPNDPELRFLLDDKPLRGDDLMKPIELTVGEHRLLVKRGDEIVREYEFNVSRDAGSRIELKERSPKAAVPVAPPPREARPLTPDEEDRRFAQWLFSIGAHDVSVTAADNQIQTLKRAEDLPAESFRVHYFGLWGNQTIADDTIAPTLRWAQRRQPPELGFYGSKLGDDAVREIVKITSIKRLNLGSRWPLTGASTKLISTRTDLIELGLNERPLGDREIADLTTLTQLEVLNLGGTQLTSAGLAHLKGMADLRVLVLDGTAVDGDGLDHLVKLPLEQLGLNETKVRGAVSLTKLAGFKMLREVYLRGLKLQDDDLRPLATSKTLRRIELSANPIADEGLKHFHAMSQLDQLRLVQCPGVTDAGVAALKKALPKCEVVR